MTEDLIEQMLMGNDNFNYDNNFCLNRNTNNILQENEYDCLINKYTYTIFTYRFLHFNNNNLHVNKNSISRNEYKLREQEALSNKNKFNKFNRKSYKDVMINLGDISENIERYLKLPRSLKIERSKKMEASKKIKESEF